jgi:hypothetical protein
MTDDLEYLRGSLSQLASETLRRQGGAHPTAEELVAYSAGELPPPAAEAVLEHLAVCRPCTHLVLGLPVFDATPQPEPDETASDPETNDSWQRLQSRLRAGPRPVIGSPAGSDAGTVERVGTHHPRQVNVALAACFAAGLAACLIGFPVWIAMHGRSPAPPPIVPVNPPERALGETQPPTAPPTALQLNAEAAALVVFLRVPQADPRIHVEILDAHGKTSSPAAATAISAQEVLVLLTHEQLPPGNYRLLVFSADARHRQLLGDYPLRILARVAR